MLQASYEILQRPSGQSFILRVFGELAFTAPYHYHPEYELTLILEGHGKRYTGSHMADFRAGDLVLIGSHLPHCWKLEPAEADLSIVASSVAASSVTASPPGISPRVDSPKIGSPSAGAIVIQFAPDFLGNGFFTRAELAPIEKLLQRSSCGMAFNNETRQLTQERIRSLAREKNNFKRLISFLEILHMLALSKDAVLLDPQRVSKELAPIDQERTHPIFAYLVENFRGEISLNKAAAIAGMTPNAFCRYFKKITRKTFMETVIDYRLNHATQQLIQTDIPISAICFDSGFGDISHFYKTFRAKMQLSPLHYRKKFMQEINAGRA